MLAINQKKKLVSVIGRKDYEKKSVEPLSSQYPQTNSQNWSPYICLKN